LARGAAQKEYEFVPASPTIWTGTLDEVQRIIRKISQELSLIIIDPLSLYDQNIKDLADQLEPCFQSPKCAVVTLGPYGWIEGPPTKIRDQLRGLSTKIYEHLFSHRIRRPEATRNAPRTWAISMRSRDLFFSRSDRRRRQPIGRRPF